MCFWSLFKTSDDYVLCAFGLSVLRHLKVGSDGSIELILISDAYVDLLYCGWPLMCFLHFMRYTLSRYLSFGDKDDVNVGVLYHSY